MPHGKRNRAFNRYAREFGKHALINRLRINYENGVTYHRPDKLPGDYNRCETEREIIDLLKNGKPDPYDKCPEYESARFRLRLVSANDAEDLFLCYGDPEAQKYFNSDNCDTDFKFATLDHMRAYIGGWLGAYKSRSYIRYAVVDKQIGKAIGTIEIFGGGPGGERDEYGILRVDVRREYENEESLDELLKISDSFFYNMNTESFLTKAVPEAVHRAAALAQNGYVPAVTGDGEKHEHYFMKRRA
jgi:hypothetical protein